jgi:very-short-patch-repair endonuclease
MLQKQKPRKSDARVRRARQLRRSMTDAERKLWWHLRQFPSETSHFRRQATIGPYFVDFTCHQKRIVIEVDGSQHFDRLRMDNLRSAFLKLARISVLRFWNNEVLQQTDAVMATIYAAVYESPAPHP